MRLTFLLLCLPCPTLAATLLHNEGIATLPDGRVAYREMHWQRGATEGAERWVQYLCPDGQPFARKHMAATDRPLARGYRLLDQRSGQQADVEMSGDAVRISWKESASSTSRQAHLQAPAGAVVDAGFDAAVRQHWTTLLQRNEVTLPFLVPGRQRFYPVKVSWRGASRWRGLAAQSFEVRLDTWYGGVAPRLSLVYAEADRRLLEFRGTSNLRDARGTYPAVVVRFDSPSESQPDSQWQQAWARPLVAGCAVTPK